MTAVVKPKSFAERLATRALTFAAFIGLGFLILRYVIGAGHTFSWSLAYIDAVISMGLMDIRDKIGGRL